MLYQPKLRGVSRQVKAEKVPIIDLHAHILPAVDDGSRNIEESVQMARMAEAQGIRHIIATPHYSLRENSAGKQLEEKTSDLQQELLKQGIQIEISTGQEILYHHGVTELLKSGEVMTLASSCYVLVEFVESVSWRELYQAARKLRMARYLPIIAHAERYQCLREEDRWEQVINAGAYIQMNFSSLSGNPLNSNVRWCRQKFLNYEVHFMGTDMHRMDRRTPEIGKTLQWMDKKAGEDYMREILYEHPKLVLEDKPLEV